MHIQIQNDPNENDTLIVGILTFCVQWSKCILLKLAAISKDSSRCIIDGKNENEYKTLCDMGDMITKHNSGGSSTVILLASAQTKQMNPYTTDLYRMPQWKHKHPHSFNLFPQFQWKLKLKHSHINFNLRHW